MLQYNTMRYGTDELAFNKQSLLIAKSPLDATNQNSVEGFVIDGAQPDGTNRKILFKVDGKLYRFDGQNPVEVTGSEDFTNVNTNGNTVAELSEVTEIPAWVGKKIYPLIALSAPGDAAVLPSIKIGLNVRASSDTFEETVESAVIDFKSTSGATPRIADVEVSGKVTGNGAFNVTARIQNNSEWSDWLPTQNVKDVDATAIQFKIRYTVNMIGSGDSARVDKIVVRYTNGTSSVSGDTAEIYSVMHDYKFPLKNCALMVRHKRLVDSKIVAFVNFTDSLKSRTFLPLGVTNGLKQTLTLGENGVPDEGIDQSSLKLYLNGTPLVAFNYNTEVGTITLSAEAGQAVTASYDYGRGREVWRQMTVDVEQEPYDDGSFLTRFLYSLPDAETDNQTVTNIRIQLIRTTGTVENEFLGKATGYTQQFVLAHAAKSETLSVNAEFSYDEDSQILTCVATEGTEIFASYDWIGESHVVYSWAATWSPDV